MNGNWIPGRRWLAVQCAPRREKLAAEHAEQGGWTVFFPRYRATVSHANRRRDVVLPYLVGYLFAQADRFMDPYDLSKTEGVAAVLRNLEGYYEIPDTDPIMRALLAMADAEGFVAPTEARKPVTRYRAGDTIRIDYGSPFDGFHALVKKLDRNRRGADVWFEIFGRPTKMFVPDENIGPVVKRAKVPITSQSNP